MKTYIVKKEDLKQEWYREMHRTGYWTVCNTNCKYPPRQEQAGFYPLC